MKLINFLQKFYWSLKERSYEIFEVFSDVQNYNQIERNLRKGSDRKISNK